MRQKGARADCRASDQRRTIGIARTQGDLQRIHTEDFRDQLGEYGLMALPAGSGNAVERNLVVGEEADRNLILGKHTAA